MVAVLFEAVLVPTVAVVVPIEIEALVGFVEAVPAVLDSLRVVGAEEVVAVEWVQFVAAAVVVVVAAEVFAAVVAIADLFEQAVTESSVEIVVVIVAAVEEAVLLLEIGLSAVEPCEAVALVAASIAAPAAALAAVEDN
jgi:hypothetical protein